MAKFGNCKQGSYKVLNLKKYLGSLSSTSKTNDRAIYRSGWERTAFLYADMTPSILAWGSENITIPYHFRHDPVGKFRNYYIDLTIVTEGETPETPHVKLVEIKPMAQCKKPKRTKGMSDALYLYKVKTYHQNMDKWRYAVDYAKNRGYEFVIWTEKNIEELKRKIPN